MNRNLKIIIIISLLFITVGMFINERNSSCYYDVIIYGSNNKSNILAEKLIKNNKRVLIIEAGNKSDILEINNSGVSLLDVGNPHDSDKKFIEEIQRNSFNVSNIDKLKDVVHVSNELLNYLKDLGTDLTNKVTYPGQTLPRSYINYGENKYESLEKNIFDHLLYRNQNLNKNKIKYFFNTEISNIEEEDIGYRVTINKENSFQVIKTDYVVFCDSMVDPTVSYNKIISDNDIDLDKLKSFSCIDKTQKGHFSDIVKNLNLSQSKSFSVRYTPFFNWESKQEIDPLTISLGSILLNKEGKRFVNETTDRNNLIKSILKQTNQEFYILYDEKIKNKAPYIFDNYKKDINNCSETITNLSLLLGIDNEALHSTILDYRSSIKNKVDYKFNRDLTTNLFEDCFDYTNVNNKFYAIKVTAASLIHKKFLEVNEDFELQGVNNTFNKFYCISKDSDKVDDENFVFDLSYIYDYYLSDMISKKIIVK